MTNQSARVRPRPDPLQFIRDNMHVATVPLLPGVRLYTAHRSSGLSRLADPDDDSGLPPYWAYQWAGGMVLARYIFDHPETVAGRRVLDLGAGCGVVGIAAALAGAGEVIAADTDRNAAAALELNAAMNGVALTVVGDDLTAGPPPAVDLVLAGDVYYDPGLALRVTAFLDRCVAAGIDVLIGDPGRAYLPRDRLRIIAEYPVPDFGEGRDAGTKASAVFTLEPA